MTRLRYHFPEKEREYVDEYNSGIHLTVPDQAKSIAEIIAMSLEGGDPLVNYVPDRPYGKDLSDVLPNVDEFNVTGQVINPDVEPQKPESDVSQNTGDSGSSDNNVTAVPEKTTKE